MDFPLDSDSWKNIIGVEGLKDIVDDSTTEVTIETPEGWKCERENCRADYLHTHGTYDSLKV